MIKPESVMIDDLNTATMEDRCIRDCLREALVGHIIGDYNMTKTRIQDAQKSINRLDKLKQRKKDFDLAREFIKPDIFWEQVRRVYR